MLLIHVFLRNEKNHKIIHKIKGIHPVKNTFILIFYILRRKCKIIIIFFSGDGL